MRANINGMIYKKMKSPSVMKGKKDQNWRKEHTGKNEALP